jgi:hypothetical protein
MLAYYHCIGCSVVAVVVVVVVVDVIGCSRYFITVRLSL